MAKANLDVHFSAFDVFTDVKVLKDNVSEILTRMYSKIWQDSRPLIHAEYPIDAGYEQVEAAHGSLLAKLRSAVENGRKPPRIDCSDLVVGLSFRLDWSRRIMVSESSYSPYRHAKQAHRLPFIHAKKFVTDRPFFLTFVVFPWFNGVITSFRGSNKVFYRALARRVFCQYANDVTPFVQWFPEFKGSETVSEVSRCLSAILFIEDNSIVGSDAGATNVVGFYYENPNGRHPPTRGMMDGYLQALARGDYDRFQHDNY